MIVGLVAVFWAVIVSVVPLEANVVPVLYVMVTVPDAEAVNDAGLDVSAVLPTDALPGFVAAAVNDRYTVAPPTALPYWSSAVSVTVTLALAARVPLGAIGLGENTYWLTAAGTTVMLGVVPVIVLVTVSVAVTV